jgi:alkanesulfonate monooxygenase SsuD/methylene tetrahydromethanopterin reductase-like flavin-dependent oxidoreductase (luciferase family)
MAVGMQEYSVLRRIVAPMRPPDDVMVVPSRHPGDFLVADGAEAVLCRLSPRPARGRVPIVCAGQSNRGMQFCAAHGDYQFMMWLYSTGHTGTRTLGPLERCG